MNKNQQGFTLFEVLISMFIAGVAVLGLVMLELNILRSSQSSFNYTIATIEANTLVDKVWRNLCAIDGAGNPVANTYSALYTKWKSDLVSSDFIGVTSSANSTNVILNDRVIVSWDDKVDTAMNSVTLNVQYPDFSGACL